MEKQQCVKSPEDIEKENQEKSNGVEIPRTRPSTRSTCSLTSEVFLKERPDKNKLPFIKYTGVINYYTTIMEIAEASDLVMQWVNKHSEEKIPIAFDMEWPFSFQTGPGRSAVIQICADEEVCYIFHLTNLKKIPAALTALLKHSKVILHGVNIKNDFRKLQRDFPEVNADSLIEKCVDLGVWCNQVCQTSGRWSLERLTNFICGLAMDKSKKIRMSKWNIVPLDDNQKLYAAIDVYISQVIYNELAKREKIKIRNESDFLEKNGQKALKAVKDLGNTFL